MGQDTDYAVWERLKAAEQGTAWLPLGATHIEPLTFLEVGVSYSNLNLPLQTPILYVYRIRKVGC